MWSSSAWMMWWVMGSQVCLLFFVLCKCVLLADAQRLQACTALHLLYSFLECLYFEGNSSCWMKRIFMPLSLKFLRSLHKAGALFCVCSGHTLCWVTGLLLFEAISVEPVSRHCGLRWGMSGIELFSYGQGSSDVMKAAFGTLTIIVF